MASQPVGGNSCAELLDDARARAHFELFAFVLRALFNTLQHNLDPTLKDLIESLLCDVEERLGSHGGAEEIKVPPPGFCPHLWETAALSML